MLLLLQSDYSLNGCPSRSKQISSLSKGVRTLGSVLLLVQRKNMLFDRTVALKYTHPSMINSTTSLVSLIQTQTPTSTQHTQHLLIVCWLYVFLPSSSFSHISIIVLFSLLVSLPLLPHECLCNMPLLELCWVPESNYFLCFFQPGVVQQIVLIFGI